ncbi:MAG TPA: HNH endonuclease signature motif containing protein, partial [Anaerolineaceae bacterium]|nr:HNH endonuclease signature motif containing protein [Anaerolineaceae bacterium]
KLLTQASLRIQNAVDSGRIRPDPHTGEVFGARGRPLKPRADRSGLLMVSFGGDYSYIHRVVAYAAFGEQALQPGVEVEHINGDLRDNRAENLRLGFSSGRGLRERRADFGSGMPYKVVDPATGKALGHFRTRELAEEYALFKFASTDAAQPRRRRA